MSSVLMKLKKMSFWVFFLMFLLMIFGLIKSLIGFFGVGERFSRVEESIVVLEEEKQYIEEKLYLENSNFIAEQQLRNSLGLSRSGEAVVVLPEKLVESVTKDREREVVVEKSLYTWQKWLALFF